MRAVQNARENHALLPLSSGLNTTAAASTTPSTATRTRPPCSKIGKTRTTLATEEQKLRDMPADILFPGDVFNSSVGGQFWGMRPYMRARSAFIHALLDVDSRESVQMQLEHARDMLRLSRSDTVGIRSAMPGAMLQLGMDPECYDFLKWYENDGPAGRLRLGGYGAAVPGREGCGCLRGCWGMCVTAVPRCVCVGAGVMLVKVRMLLDLKDLHMQSTSAAGAVMADARQLRSSIIANNAEILHRGDHTAAVALVEGQVKELYRAIHSSNKHFWEVLLEPEEHLHAMPGMYSPGTLSEVQVMLRYIYPAWAMTPGALELAEDLTKRKP
ncbi:uncharacterized protein BDCG_04205 [Blastomyces dermatitidis ER-3]|uniref:Uncharacterized protein n=1 Tax=Ajellomyces dermatitidis (strain ER-3 / ATCC MYA-2586) TaxID=559297 RepID=A0ABP2F2D4_AJEDR|nr:uncharacterized protein BDCG_04205 [Blastomyces dermatitidis ER-3]EEQ89085.2 hypothetical protein BDCG_04205 [Blastomyces dermatitidis ER-3]